MLRGTRVISSLRAGLLKSLNNEAELAGVLAHEVAHVTKTHAGNHPARSGPGKRVRIHAGGHEERPQNVFQRHRPKMTDVLFTKGLDQEKEFEADVVGIEHAYRAGYHPQGLKDYLMTLAKAEGCGPIPIFSPPILNTGTYWQNRYVLNGYSDLQGLPFSPLASGNM
ncbi:MAG: M48 family metalloprotease [Nitrospirales bacterium]|nr:M48 family metalloprotease [Nitrospirales bacterium]